MNDRKRTYGAVYDRMDMAGAFVAGLTVANIFIALAMLAG